ncbi:hypothetical protein QQ045_029903 [Rhodiola kirilowii]
MRSKVHKTYSSPKAPKPPKHTQTSQTNTESISKTSKLPNLQSIPNLQTYTESISQTSKAYLSKANRKMTRNFKQLIGIKYASATANFVSFAFIILPLILISLLVSHIKTYFSLQKLLIFINIYLFIYLSMLSLSAVVTGLEPLHFLFATSYCALSI